MYGNIYSKIYPAGSAPGKFYGIAKIHKLLPNDTINELPLRPIVSNIGSATCHLSKYLAKLLSPLSKSEYTIKSTKYFVEKIKKEHIPNDHLLVPFDVKSLFTNVPLDQTIEIILNRIYVQKASSLHSMAIFMFRMTHCVKGIQIRSFFWSVFSRIQTEYEEISSCPYLVQIRKNRNQRKLRI